MIVRQCNAISQNRYELKVEHYEFDLGPVESKVTKGHCLGDTL